MDGVGCESIWCIEQMCRYRDGKKNIFGLKDTNHNMKILIYQLVGGSSPPLPSPTLPYPRLPSPTLPYPSLPSSPLLSPPYVT